MTYCAGTHQKCDESIIAETTARGCDVYQNKDFNVNVEVPNTLPTEVSAGVIMKVQYCIRVLKCCLKEKRCFVFHLLL